MASLRKTVSSSEERSGEIRKIPSAAFGSYRSSSSRPQKDEGDPEMSMWGKVKKSLVNNTLVAVGLRPTREEGRHWDAVKGILSDRKASLSMDLQDGGVIQRSHKLKDTPLVRHVSGRDFSSILSRVEDDGTSPAPGRQASLSKQLSRQMSVRKLDRATGRSQALPLDQLKPDLWKLAFNSIRSTSIMGRKASQTAPQAKERSSFDFLDGDDDVDNDDVFSPSASAGGYPSPLARIKEEEEEEDTFFGFEASPGRVETDGAEEGGEATVPVSPTRKAKHVRRGKMIKDAWNKFTLSEGYVGGGGGLGVVTKVLFRYKHLTKEQQELLDSKLLHKRPYFSYWLMAVHVIVMIVSLALYGFAPYGWDLIQQRESVRQTDLSFATTERSVVPNVWLGPPQQDLVLLGALFAPCMRRDRQIFEAIEGDRMSERDDSGCCVRRDMSGCFQVARNTTCQPRFSNFFFDVDGARAVCGTSPDTCTDPAPGVSRGDQGVWVRNDTLTWPICRADTNANASAAHLTCEITSRPCCHGIQANCIITTRELCDFLNGRFQQDAFLCSQVDCLNDICGLLPFAEFNQPDQVYRLYIALFLHAGLLHLVLSLIFSFLVLRLVEKRLGWWRTAVLYIVSGIGGNLVSAYLAPYNPEVGPAGSILGVVAYFFVFLIFEIPLLEKWWQEALKLLGVCAFLFVLGLFPFIDNYAHIGGFVFGFLISGILVPYGDFKEVCELTDHKNKERYKVLPKIKIAMVVVGLVVVVLLFTLFFILLYVVQDTWVGFSYLTCIPFTSTLCVDQQVLIRDRDLFIV